MKFLVKIVFWFLVLSFFIFSPFAVQAQYQDVPQGIQPSSYDFLRGLIPCGTSYAPQPCTVCYFYQLLKNIINFFVYVSGPLAVLFIVAFVVPPFFFGGGDPKRIGEAKERFKLIVIGLIWVAVSWLVLNTLLNLVVNRTVFPWPWNRITCQAIPSTPSDSGGSRPSQGGSGGGGGVPPVLGFGSRLDNNPSLSEEVFGGGETGGGGAGCRTECWEDAVYEGTPGWDQYVNEPPVFAGLPSEGSSLSTILVPEVFYPEERLQRIRDYVLQNPEASSLRPLLEPESLSFQEAEQIVNTYISQRPQQASTLRPLLEPEQLSPAQARQEVLRQITPFLPEIDYPEERLQRIRNYVLQNPEASSLRPLLYPETLTAQEAAEIVNAYVAQRQGEASTLRPLLEPEQLSPAQARQKAALQAPVYKAPKYNQQIDDYVSRASLNGVDPNKIKALIMTESSGNPSAVSRDNDGLSSYGLMQIRPDTARRYDPSLRNLTDAQVTERLKDPGYNINIGSQYLRDLEQKYGSTDLAVAAFNGGPLANRASRSCPGLRRWQCEWDIPGCYQAQALSSFCTDDRKNSRPGHPGYGPTRREVSVFNQLYNQLSGR